MSDQHEHSHVYLHAHGMAHSHGHVHENQKAVINRLLYLRRSLKIEPCKLTAGGAVKHRAKPCVAADSCPALIRFLSYNKAPLSVAHMELIIMRPVFFINTAKIYFVLFMRFYRMHIYSLAYS